MTNSIRLNKVIKEFNVGLQTIVEFLQSKGITVEANPSEKISNEQYELLKKEYGADKELRGEVDKQKQDRQKEKNKAKKAPAASAEVIKTEIPESMRPQIKTTGHINLDAQSNPVSKKVELAVEKAENTEKTSDSVQQAESKQTGTE